MTINMTKAKKYIQAHGPELIAVACVVAVAGVAVYQHKQDYLHLTKKAAKHLSQKSGNTVYYSVKGHLYELMEVVVKPAD